MTIPIEIGRQNPIFSISSIIRGGVQIVKTTEEKIFRKRKELKISQTVLAERAGLTRNCIQQMECHEHLPLPSTMFKLIRAFHFSQEEAAEFWIEIENAYNQDRRLQETNFKPLDMPPD